MFVLNISGAKETNHISGAKETNHINGAKEINNISGAKETLSLSKVFSLWPQCFFVEDAYTRPIYGLLDTIQIHLIPEDEAEAGQELKLEINESLSNQTKNESNMVVDTVNLNEDTFETLPIAEETDQISEDTETDQISEDRETDQISEDRETDQISEDTETDEVPKNTETDQIPENDQVYKNRRFSEHLFDKCVTNGKHKLSYIFPQNRIIFSTYFSNVFETLDFSKPLKSNVYQNWVYSKSIRKTNLKNILKNRIKTLDKENSMDIVLDQKTRSKDYAENFIENTLDLRLNSNKRGYQLCLFGNEDDQMVVDKDVNTLDIVDTLDSVDHVFDPLIETPFVDTDTRLAINTELPLRLHFHGYHTMEKYKTMLIHPKHRHVLSSTLTKASKKAYRMNNTIQVEWLPIKPTSILLNRNLYYTSSVPIKIAKKLFGIFVLDTKIETPYLSKRQQRFRTFRLRTQAEIRRVKVVMLIRLKNTVRWFLRQPSEFKQDMVELEQETWFVSNASRANLIEYFDPQLNKEALIAIDGGLQN